MSKSLQDQLLELGLAKDRPAGKRKRGKPSRRKPRKDGGRGPGATAGLEAKARAGADLTLEEAFRLREEVEKSEARAAKRRKREEDRRRRKINESIRAIVEPNRLNDADAEEARYFMYKGRIRKVHVTAEQLEGLNENRLGLVYLMGGYHILEPGHVDAVRQISSEHVVDLAADTDADDSGSADEAEEA
ncbi:DUF2058 family protein [Elongatibacter sediminis]|uniref:DUF2058 family protein n=1 Tax=Elongatibacter sediminis TaxID=3119006 RepID=A0AAW9RBH5_9GAMM